MRAVALGLVVGCSALIAIARADEPALRWLRSLDDAKVIAAAEHKDLLVNFTGLEWCGHCKELESEVLSRREFRAAAADFVLVDLDFPSDTDQLGALRGPYEEWVQQYRIHGYPTVVLIDPTGKPYAYFTGYDDEVDVATYMDQLAAARKARESRDRELAAAKQATGAARAQKLHAAISAVAPVLGSVEERDDDPVLIFYHDEVEEIRQLDADNAQSLREIYDARIKARDEYRRQNAVLAELNQFGQDWSAAIAHIDKRLTEITDVKLRFRLEQRRCSLLDWGERYAEALEAGRRLLQDPACPAGDRNWMLRNQAILLNRLGRLDEALAFYDEQISAAEKDPRSHAYFLSWKVNLLFGTGRHDEILATCRQWRAAEKPKSRGWSEATYFLAWSLQNAGQHDNAIPVYQELLAYDREIGRTGAGTLLAIASSLHALGRAEDERRTLDDAEKAIALQAERPAKHNVIDELREMLRKARESQLEKTPNANGR